MPKIVIVGGGISGLVLAYRLEQKLPDADVRVLERGERTGGTVATIVNDGFRIEAGPNGFLDNNPATLQLCADLRIEHHLVAASEAARKNRYLLHRGKLRLLPSSLSSFLFSDVMSWRSKAYLLLERFRPRGPEAADESIDAFVRRRVGGELADTLADAFVTGIFAGDPTLLSVRAALPRIAAYEREHGSIQRGMAAARKQRGIDAQERGETPPTGSRMWSFPEGLGFLIEKLRDVLRQKPATGVAVQSVKREGNRWVIRGDGKDRWEAHAVALTCPAHQQAFLLNDLDATLSKEIADIPYNRVAVVALGFRQAEMPKPLDGFGYLSPGRERRDVLGVQWCSTIFPERAPSGTVLLRAMCGGWHRPEMVDWENERLIDAVRAELAAVMGIAAAPVFQQIVRWPNAIPQYHLGHLDRIARIETLAARHPGLHLGGNAYRGVALNDCVEQAGLLADKVAKSLAARQEEMGLLP